MYITCLISSENSLWLKELNQVLLATDERHYQLNIDVFDETLGALAYICLDGAHETNIGFVVMCSLLACVIVRGLSLRKKTLHIHIWGIWIHVNTDHLNE